MELAHNLGQQEILKLGYFLILKSQQQLRLERTGDSLEEIKGRYALVRPRFQPMARARYECLSGYVAKNSFLSGA
jgi:hypothetical protein